ncbi:MAG TPA: cell division/cell wall cluster transcriptional repressor MraZ [Desulfotomaculum sp.]|nr:cell division/cell wall cluster transcriptional repressor MraZ [Desulfotomaculum sp.]
MFMGEYQHTIDDKGRLFIPARFRDSLGIKFVLTKGLDSCLFAYPPQEWTILEEKMRLMPFTSADVRAFVRFFFGGACECLVDRQGRILVPNNLRKHAALEKEAVIIGVSSRVEIWSRENWEKYNSGSADLVEQIAEKIGGFGIVV